jgi:hypothetical protein
MSSNKCNENSKPTKESRIDSLVQSRTKTISTMSRCAGLKIFLWIFEKLPPGTGRVAKPPRPSPRAGPTVRFEQEEILRMSRRECHTRSGLGGGEMKRKLQAEEQRRRWRERQQRSRANRAAKEEEDEIRELANEMKKAIRESLDGEVPRWFFATHGVTATLEAMKFLGITPPPSKKPGVPIPDMTPEEIKARSDKFDQMKAECERKAIEETKLVLWAFRHGIPISYAKAHFPNGIPEKKANDATGPGEPAATLQSI